MRNQFYAQKIQNGSLSRKNAEAELSSAKPRQGSPSFPNMVNRATDRVLQQNQLTIQAQVLQQDKQHNELHEWNACENLQLLEGHVEQQAPINAASVHGNQFTPSCALNDKLVSTDADSALSYSEQSSINERNTLLPITHQSPPSSSTGCRPESFVDLLEQDKVFLHGFRQEIQQYSSVLATNIIIAALECNPSQDQGIPATLENSPLLQEASQDDCQQEHYSQSSTRMQTNNYQAEHANIIYHGGPPYPSPPVTPSEASSSSNIIAGITSDDFPLAVREGSEEASSDTSFTTHSESISTNGDDEGLFDHRKENNGRAEGRFYCRLCPSDQHDGFSRERDIKRHDQQVHGKKRHRCDECEKTYSRPDAVKRHKKDTHEKNK